MTFLRCLHDKNISNNFCLLRKPELVWFFFFNVLFLTKNLVGFFSFLSILVGVISDQDLYFKRGGWSVQVCSLNYHAGNAEDFRNAKCLMHQH